MTDLRKAAEMALEALECMKGYGNVFLSRSHEQKPYDQVCAAIEALRQALAQPEQEPVVGTKTWFEDGNIVTQNLYASDIYTAPPIKEKNT